MKSASQWIKTVIACLIFVSPRCYYYVGQGKKRRQHVNRIQNQSSHPGMESPDFKLKLVFMINVSILHDICLSFFIVWCKLLSFSCIYNVHIIIDYFVIVWGLCWFYVSRPFSKVNSSCANGWQASLKNWEDCYIKVHCSDEFSSGAKQFRANSCWQKQQYNNMPLGGVEMRGGGWWISF